MVAHSAHQVRRIAERGIWLENGRVERDGPVIDVQDAYTKFLIVEKSRSDAKAQDAKQQHLANVAESIESKPAPGIEGPLVRILGAKSVADFAEWEPNTTYEVMVRFETLVDFVELRPRVRLTSTGVNASR